MLDDGWEGRGYCWEIEDVRVVGFGSYGCGMRCYCGLAGLVLWLVMVGFVVGGVRTFTVVPISASVRIWFVTVK